MGYRETNDNRFPQMAGLLCAAILILAASSRAAIAQTETSYPVQSEPNPLVDATARVGSTSDPLSNAQTQDYTYEDISETNAGLSTTIFGENFDDGDMGDWDTGPTANETRVLANGGANWGGQTVTCHDGAGQSFEGRDSDGSDTYIQKNLGNLSGYTTRQLSYWWAEQDIEADETCPIEIYDPGNGWQTLQQIGSNNGNDDGIAAGEWTQQTYNLESLSTYGLTNISNWTDIRIRFTWVAALDTSGTDDEWFLDNASVTGTIIDYRLNWEHRVTGIGTDESYKVRIYGYSDAGETFSVKVWNGATWVDNGYNLPTGAGAWVEYQIPASWVIGGAVSIKYDDDTDGDTTSDNIHIDYSEVLGTTAPSFDFSADASPASVTIAQGDSTTSTITAALVSGATQTVSLTGSWVGTTPGGVTAGFTPSSGTPTFSSSLGFSTTAGASVGTFVYRVTADNGSLTRTKDVTLTINQAAAFNYSVAAPSSSLSLVRDNSTTSTITVEYLSGTAASVSLSGAWVGTSPTGIGATFSPESGTPAIGAPFTSTLTFTASPTASGGTFTYRATGTSGSTTRTCDVTATLPPAAPSLSSPGNGTAIDTLTPTFDWDDATGATQYTLQLATDNNFSNIVITKSPLESTATLDESEKLSYATNYYWRVRGSNAAGSGSWSQTWTFIAKQAAPKVTSVTVAGGASYTSSAGVQLTLNAQNSAEMSFSGDGVVWDNWESCQASKTYTVSGADGQKNIYIRVRDNSGDISQTFLTQVTLDQTPPTTTNEAAGDLGADGYKNSVVITLVPADATSGVGSTTYSVDGGEWQTGTTIVISTPGKHTVEYSSIDLAGNTEATKSFDVTVYTPAAPLDLLNYWWAIIAVIIGVGLGWVLVVPKVRASGRLQKIAAEKKEIIGLIKETEAKYYKEGSISRDVFQEVVREHEKRMAELEKEARVLKAKMKKKVKEKKRGKERKTKRRR